MKKIFFVSFLILLFITTNPAFAGGKQNLGQAGMTFLSIGGSARAAGMADILDFAKNDLGSAFYNPAGLGSVENRAFYFNYTQWIADMSVAHMAFSWNFEDIGVFALSAQIMNYGKFNGTTIAQNTQGYTNVDVGNVSAMVIGLGYGVQMTEQFYIGGNVKWISQNLGQNDTYIGGEIESTGKTNNTGDIAFDFGTMYDTDIRSIMLTMSIRNYSSQQLYENEEFTIPQTFKIGVAADLIELFSNPNKDHKVFLALEGVDARDRTQYINVGVEYTLIQMVVLRAGWASNRNQDDMSPVTFGAGFILDSSSFLGKVDFSYSSFDSALGSILRFSISGAF
ncbi:MAG: PorV/PorQ family protein [Chlorobi bacterium]|nr:PorV/PorQ family protein [Chlorobiota bacterium]